MLFNLDFASDIILSSFFLFLCIDLDLLVPAVITQISNTIAELEFPNETPTKEAMEEIETHPVIGEITTSECSI